jgi:hypothetical protein
MIIDISAPLAFNLSENRQDQGYIKTQTSLLISEASIQISNKIFSLYKVPEITTDYNYTCIFLRQTFCMMIKSLHLDPMIINAILFLHKLDF